MLDEQIEQQQQLTKQQERRQFLKIFLILAVLSGIAGSYFLIKPLLEAKQSTEQLLKTVDDVKNTFIAEQAREKFKTQLQQYEQHIAPKLTTIQAGEWRAQQIEQQLEQHQQAILLFSQEQYQQALTELEQVITTSTTLIQKWEQAFQKQLAITTTYFQAREQAQAEQAIKQTFAINPDDQEAHALADRIQHLGAINDLERQLRQAIAENNQQQQINILQKILAIDANYPDWQQTLQQHLKQQQTQEINQRIQQAFTAIKANKIQTAQAHYEHIKSIAPKRSELLLLQQQLQQHQQNTALTTALAAINKQMIDDQWQSVLNLATTTLKQFPYEQPLQQVQQLAQKILTTKKQVQKYLAQPQRLQDEKIYTQAQQLLSEQQTLGEHSPALQQPLQQLEQLLAKYVEPTAVTIISDGKTAIKVIGRGYVKQAKQHIIQLPPGKYTFEGFREGFRSKRKQMTITPNKENKVTLICDERIK